jgi:hypothetical protein
MDNVLQALQLQRLNLFSGAPLALVEFSEYAKTGPAKNAFLKIKNISGDKGNHQPLLFLNRKLKGMAAFGKI